MKNLKKYIRKCIEEALTPDNPRMVHANFPSEEERDVAIKNIGIKPISTFGKRVVKYKASSEKNAEEIKSKIEKEGGKAMIGVRDIEAYKKKAL